MSPVSCFPGIDKSETLPYTVTNVIEIEQRKRIFTRERNKKRVKVITNTTSKVTREAPRLPRRC